MGRRLFPGPGQPLPAGDHPVAEMARRTAGEIAAHFSISQPSISRHLDVLKRAEIITAERRGTRSSIP